MVQLQAEAKNSPDADAENKLQSNDTLNGATHETMPAQERAALLEEITPAASQEDLFARSPDTGLATAQQRAESLHSLLTDRASAIEVLDEIRSLSPSDREQMLESYKEQYGTDLLQDSKVYENFLESERALLQKAIAGQTVAVREQLEVVEERVQNSGRKLGNLSAEGTEEHASEIQQLNEEHQRYVSSIQRTELATAIPNLEQSINAERSESTQRALQEGSLVAAQRDIKSQIVSAESSLGGYEKTLQQLNKQIEQYDRSWSQYNPWAANFWRGGEIEALRIERDQLKRTIRESKEHIEQLHEVADGLASERKAFTSAAEGVESRKEELGKQLERLVELNQSAPGSAEFETQRQLVQDMSTNLQQEAADLEKIRVTALEAIPADLRQRQSEIITRYSKALRDSNEMLGNHIETLNQRERQIELARNTVIIIGAGVATGGLASGSIALYGGVTLASVAGSGTATTVAAVTLGTAVGTTAGALSNTAEAVQHVNVGNKGVGEAFSDALDKTGADAKNSAISSVAAISGIGAGNYVRGGATTVRAMLQAGAVTGGTNAAVNYTLNTGDQYRIAANEFNEKYAGSGLNDEQLAEIWQKEFAEPRGLTGGAIFTNGVITVTAGSLSGGVGAGSGVAQQASQTVSRRIVAEGVEYTADVGVALGATYAQNGEVTTEDLVRELGTTLTGSTLGKMQAQGATNSAPGRNGEQTEGSTPIRANETDTASTSAPRDGEAAVDSTAQVAPEDSRPVGSESEDAAPTGVNTTEKATDDIVLTGADTELGDTVKIEMDQVRPVDSVHVERSAPTTASELSQSINERLGHLTRDQIEAIVGAELHPHRAEVLEYLAESSRFANFYGVEEIRRVLPLPQDTPEGGGLYVPASGSIADVVAYGSKKNGILNGSAFAQTQQLGPDTYVILDKVVLERMQSDPVFAREVAESGAKLINPVGLNDGINLYNNNGPIQVELKMVEIMDAAQVIKKEPEFASATPAELTREYFLRQTEERLRAIEQQHGISNQSLSGQIRNSALQVDGAMSVPRGQETVDSIALQLNGYQGITSSRLEQALSRYEGDDLQRAITILDETVVVYSPRTFSNELAGHHDAIVGRATELGFEDSQIRYYIPFSTRIESGKAEGKPSSRKSYDPTTYAYREANPEVAASAFLNKDTIRQRDSSTGELVVNPKKEVVVILDDFSGTGSSVRDAVNDLRDTGYSGQIIIAPLVSTSKTRQTIQLMQKNDPDVHLVTAREVPTFREHELYRSAGREEQLALEKTAGNLGHGRPEDQVGVAVFFPHMSPNNNHGLAYRALGADLTHNGGGSKPPGGDRPVHRNQKTIIERPEVMERSQEVLASQTRVTRPGDPPSMVQSYLGVSQSGWYSRYQSLDPATVDPLFFRIAEAIDEPLILGGGSDLTQVTLGLPKRVVGGGAEVNRVVPKQELGDIENMFSPEFTVVAPEWNGRPGGEIIVSLNTESARDIQLMVQNDEQGRYVLQGVPTTANAPLKQAAVVDIRPDGEAVMYFRTEQDKANFENRLISFADSQKFAPADWVNRSGLKGVMLVETVAYAGTLLSRGQAQGWNIEPASLGIAREMVSRMSPAERLQTVDRIRSNLSSPESAAGKQYLDDVLRELGLQQE